MDMKKLKATCAILTSFCLINSFAQDVCQLRLGAFDKKFRIKETPGFFFKVHPSGEYLSYIGRIKNQLLDLNSGESYPAAHFGDPVWTPDGKFLTQINFDSLTFFPEEEYTKNILSNTPEKAQGFEVKMPGVYQSVGKVKDGYKVATDHEKLSIVNLDSAGKIISDIKRPCGNIKNFPTDLPMLSKDGKFLSVYDSKSKSTKLFNIEHDKCSLALDLGFGTGKVSFNMDSSQISFHLDQFDTTLDESGWFSGIYKDKVKNVVVMNLDKTKDGKLVPSSWALASGHTRLGDGGYYPDFDAKGNLYYMEDIDNQFQIVKVLPSQLEFRKYSHGVIANQNSIDCDNLAPNIVNTVAQMWTDLCKNSQKVSLTQEKSLIATLDPVLCLKMIDEHWVPSMGNKEDLKKVCPIKINHHGSITGVWEKDKTQDAQDVIQSRCVSCHTRPMNVEVERKITVDISNGEYEQKTIKSKISIPALTKDINDPYTLALMSVALQSGEMPKGGDGGKDIDLLKAYLEKKLMDLPGGAASYVGNGRSVSNYKNEAIESEIKDILSHLPEGTDEEEKQLIRIESYCRLGQKKCDEYIEKATIHLKKKALKLPIEQRARYVNKNIMEVRCEALYKVTYEECLKYKIDQNFSKQLAY